MPLVLVSAKSARQEFHGCEPEYIATVCHGACCRSSSGPILVTLLGPEEAAMRRRGVEVAGGLLAPGEKRCPFQTPAELCGLHGGPDKPFGCIASPFMLTARDTLVIRNRYRLLKCFRDGSPPLPAYQAFRASLDLLLGQEEAEGLCGHLEAGGGDRLVEMRPGAYNALRAGDALKKKSAEGRR